MNLLIAVTLLAFSGFIFLQNRKPLEKRALLFDNPLGPLIYISLSFLGLYILSKQGFLIMVMGWFAGTIIFGISLNIIFEKILNRPK